VCPPAGLVDAVVAIVVEEMLGEGRHVVQVLEEGAARCPGTSPPGPGRLNRGRVGGPYAWSGSWQLAHEVAPEAERRIGEERAPGRVMAATVGCFSNRDP
jgi:hypothetical protein